MKHALILLALLAATATAAPNDFTKDPNCVALWSFENGALTTDSIGTNTLSNTGVVADTVNYKELAASADIERDDSSDVLSIVDASLSTKFPLKDGDANKKISVCCWIKPETMVNGAIHAIFTKRATNKNSIKLYVYGQALNDFQIPFQIGTSGGASWETVLPTVTTFPEGVWYHYALTYQDSDKSWKMRLWDGSTVYNYSGNTTNNINVEDADLRIGNTNISERYDGLIDELVVFNDILTIQEIDAIRGGTYGASAVRNWWWRRRHEN